MMSEQKPEEKPVAIQEIKKNGEGILDLLDNPRHQLAAIFSVLAVGIGGATLYSHLNREAAYIDESACYVGLSYHSATKMPFYNVSYNFKDQMVSYSYRGDGNIQQVNFKDLSPLDRAKAREVAEKLPMECRYQKKFDL